MVSSWVGWLLGVVVRAVLGAIIYFPFLLAILFQSLTDSVVDPSDWAERLRGSSWGFGAVVALFFVGAPFAFLAAPAPLDGGWFVGASVIIALLVAVQVASLRYASMRPELCTVQRSSTRFIYGVVSHGGGGRAVLGPSAAASPVRVVPATTRSVTSGPSAIPTTASTPVPKMALTTTPPLVISAAAEGERLTRNSYSRGTRQRSTADEEEDGYGDAPSSPLAVLEEKVATAGDADMRWSSAGGAVPTTDAHERHVERKLQWALQRTPVLVAPWALGMWRNWLFVVVTLLEVVQLCTLGLAASPSLAASVEDVVGMTLRVVVQAAGSAVWDFGAGELYGAATSDPAEFSFVMGCAFTLAYASLCGIFIALDLKPTSPLGPVLFSFLAGGMHVTATTSLIRVVRSSTIPARVTTAFVCLSFFSATSVFVSIYRSDKAAVSKNEARSVPLILGAERVLKGLLSIALVLFIDRAKAAAIVVLLAVFAAVLLIARPSSVEVINDVRVGAAFAAVWAALLAVIADASGPSTAWGVLLVVGWALLLLVFGAAVFCVPSGTVVRFRRRCRGLPCCHYCSNFLPASPPSSPPHTTPPRSAETPSTSSQLDVLGPLCACEPYTRSAERGEITVLRNRAVPYCFVCARCSLPPGTLEEREAAALLKLRIRRLRRSAHTQPLPLAQTPTTSSKSSMVSPTIATNAGTAPRLA